MNFTKEQLQHQLVRSLNKRTVRYTAELNRQQRRQLAHQQREANK